MRLMRRVVENRLASPDRFSAHRAQNEQQIASMGGQFAGFRDYPTLAGTLADRLDTFVQGVRSGDSAFGTSSPMP